MSVLKNHLILFDAECALCTAYSRALVKAGLLEEKGRTAYQDLGADACPVVDRRRAANEIALVNLETGEVSYGIHSLFLLFSQAAPALKPIFTFGPFTWLMSKLYAFIAFNRRVIFPPAGNRQGLQPELHKGYRAAYLLVALLITSWLVTGYILRLNDPLPIGDFLTVFFLLMGQLIVQAVILQISDRGKTWDYLGNMVTTDLAGAFFLLPMIVVPGSIRVPVMVYAVYLLLVLSAVLYDHFRRGKRLGTGLVPLVTWALYTLWVTA